MSTRESTGVPCPFCGQPAGELCRVKLVSGRTTTSLKPHRSRREAAERA